MAGGSQTRENTMKTNAKPSSIIGLTLAAASLMIFSSFTGCLKNPSPVKEDPPKQSSVIGQMTTDVAEFDPVADVGRQADLTIDTSRPLHAMTAGAYKNILGRAAELSIKQAVNLFQAEHGRYPKDYDEFMERIIKYNNIELPVLPGNLRYAYDVETHELKIIEGQ